MPGLANHQSQDRTKALYVGDSGTGKTGSLVSLVRAGYKLRILDFDNGLDILANKIRQEPNAQDLMQQVEFVTLTDDYKHGAPHKPKAWVTARKMLDGWKEKDEEGNVIKDLGPASSWDTDTVLVIDSLTFASKACLNFVLAQAGRLGQTPWINDYGETVRLLRDFLGNMYSETIQCNTLVLAHITYISWKSQDNTEQTSPYPMAVGKSLPPEVGNYFNTMIKARVKGSGQSTKRVIKTTPEPDLALKSPAPDELNSEYPIDTGLAEIFRVLQGRTSDDVKQKAEPSSKSTA